MNFTGLAALKVNYAVLSSQALDRPWITNSTQTKLITPRTCTCTHSTTHAGVVGKAWVLERSQRSWWKVFVIPEVRSSKNSRLFINDRPMPRRVVVGARTLVRGVVRGSHTRLGVGVLAHLGEMIPGRRRGCLGRESSSCMAWVPAMDVLNEWLWASHAHICGRQPVRPAAGSGREGCGVSAVAIRAGGSRGAGEAGVAGLRSVSGYGWMCST